MRPPPSLLERPDPPKTLRTQVNPAAGKPVMLPFPLQSRQLLRLPCTLTIRPGRNNEVLVATDELKLSTSVWQAARCTRFLSGRLTSRSWCAACDVCSSGSTFGSLLALQTLPLTGRPPHAYDCRWPRPDMTAAAAGAGRCAAVIQHHLSIGQARHRATARVRCHLGSLPGSLTVHCRVRCHVPCVVLLHGGAGRHI